MAFLFLFTSYYLNLSREKKINLALCFVKFVSVNTMQNEKEYVIKASS